MTKLIQDFRYGLRVLRKSPGFATVAILVLGLGIGANTAIFSVVNTVLLRPLPFEDPARIVHVWHVPPPKSFPGMTTFSVSTANYIDWRQQNNVFEDMAMYTGSSMNLTGGDKAESLLAATVEPNFFSVLGAKPLLGRTFLAGEEQPGQNHKVVLTHAFWQSRIGGDRNIVGKQITLDDEPYTVVGVMGPGFMYPMWEEKLWIPLTWSDKERAVRGEHHSTVVARLKRGVDINQAQAEMSTISDLLARQYPEDDKDWGAVVVPLREDIVGDVRPALLVLLGAVAFVLLIACANVANLLLARALARSKEIAIRTALGASRARLMQQLLFETILLALGGGVAGLLVANFGVDLIVRFLAQQLPRATEISLDAGVLGFTLAISLVTGIVAGIVPAWKLSKANVNETLKQGLGRAGDSGGNRTRSALVVCEARYKSPVEEINFWTQALARMRALPGVETAAAVDDLPFNGGSHQPIAIEGTPAVTMSEQPEVDVRVISTGYLRAMHIPLVRGRDFNESDTADTPGAILISDAMAKRFWPNEDALGKRLTLTFAPEKIREIVGVVGDVKLDGLDQAKLNSVIYEPLTQISTPPSGEWRSFGLDVVVRTTTPPATLVSAVTNNVHEIDPQQAVAHVMTMDQFMAESISPQRFNMLLLATFAGLALVLAAIGIYSVLSYAVRRRVREIGIRMALGAQIRDVLRLVVFEGMKPAIVGMVIGLTGAMLLGRVLAKLVFGVKTTDPATLAAVSILLLAVALLATALPAHRATRVDPMRTLRDE